MALFRYRAFAKDGKIVEGFIEGGNEQEAIEILKDKELSIIFLHLIKEKTRKVKKFLKFTNKVKSKELVVFARQLSVMASATLPLVQALRILVQQTKNPYFKEVVNDIADEVDGGNKLSIAMSKYPDIFNHFFVSMVKSGETSGKIDEVMNYLADEMEKDYDLVSRIKGAMIYPAFIIFGLIVVGALMMIFVVPKLTEMLLQSGAQLPLTTRMLIAVSNFMVNYWWVLVLVILLAPFFLKTFSRTKSGKRNLDLAKIYFPIFGKLFQRIYIVRFCRSLGTLMTGGVPLTVGLRVSKEVVGNVAFEELIDQTIAEVEDGNPIASVFSRSKFVPMIVSQMLNIGERTGRLDSILEKVASFYQREINNTVQNLASLIEPVVMLVIGLGVGVMVSAIIMPMYQLANTF